MNHDLNISILRKLKAAYPESGDYIFKRAEEIFQERVKSAEGAAFIRGVDTALSPLTAKFWKSALKGMGSILDGMSEIVSGTQRPPRTVEISHESDWKALGSAFDWATENVKLAACDFIKTHNVPMELFTEEERTFIKGDLSNSRKPTSAPENNL